MKSNISTEEWKGELLKINGFRRSKDYFREHTVLIEGEKFSLRMEIN